MILNIWSYALYYTHAYMIFCIILTFMRFGLDTSVVVKSPFCIVSSKCKRQFSRSVVTGTSVGYPTDPCSYCIEQLQV